MVQRKAASQVAIYDPQEGLVGIPLPWPVPTVSGQPDPIGRAGFGAYHDDFVATANQTSFVLHRKPAEANLVAAVVDHLFFYAPINLTVTLNVVVWIPASAFPMKAGQQVRIYYT